MREIDQISLDIYADLKQEYEDNIKENGPYLNIFGIFMHELMIYLTNYIIIKQSKYEYNYELNFPFLNKKYIQKPYTIKFDKNSKDEDINYKRKIVDTLFWFGIFGKTVAYSDHTMADGIKYLLKNIFKYKVYKIKNIKCCLPNKEQQFSNLNNYLELFCNKYNVENKNIFIDNFIVYIAEYIQDDMPQIKGDLYISGSQLSLYNRIISAYYLNENKQVIAFAHGEQDMLTLDDPYGGYGDMSYCSKYISYGSKELNFGKYNKPLKEHIPKIFRKNSVVIDFLLKDNVVIKPKRINGLYIPTGFSNNNRYGPFRDIDDEDYLDWQKKLFNFDSNLTYKDHPSSHKEQNFVKKNKTIKENLKNIDFTIYDFIILDFMSTAFAISASTSLPIIYFNLGLMNISKQVVSDVKARVFWVDIDLSKDLTAQIKNAFYAFFNSDNIYNKDYIYKYSLSDNSLDNILKQILND